MAVRSVRLLLNVPFATTVFMCLTAKKNVLSPSIFALLILSNMPTMVLIITVSNALRDSTSTLKLWNVKSAINHVTLVLILMYV